MGEEMSKNAIWIGVLDQILYTRHLIAVTITIEHISKDEYMSVVKLDYLTTKYVA